MAQQQRGVLTTINFGIYNSIDQQAITVIQQEAAQFANTNFIENIETVQETVTLLNNFYRNNTALQLQETIRGLRIKLVDYTTHLN